MPESYRTIIQPRASRDIISICSYIEKRSPQNAGIVAQMLLDAVDSLGMLPQRYEVYRSDRNAAKVVHSMAVPPFIIYYRILKPHRAVEVLTIRHGARRQPKRF